MTMRQLLHRCSAWARPTAATEMREFRWTRPELVVQVRFTEWTPDGRLREVAYVGLRSDKSASEVRREVSRLENPGQLKRPVRDP